MHQSTAPNNNNNTSSNNNNDMPRLHTVFGKLGAAVLPQRLGPQDDKPEDEDTLATFATTDNPHAYCGDLVAVVDMAARAHAPPPYSVGVFATVSEVMRRLEAELRAAKSGNLACGEVLLPCGLLETVAGHIYRLAETEPCGVRGALLHLNYETVNDTSCRRHLASIKCDPTTAATFELYLTLKQQTATTWTFLPRLLKNLARGGTVVISPVYVLTKKQLYRSNYLD